MSTRSNILVTIAGDAPGSTRVNYIYCHSDGYISYTGHMLHTYYSTIEQARALVALGDLSLVRPRLAPEPWETHTFDNRNPDVTIAYGRDRGEANTESREGESTEMLDDLPYAYYHNGTQWYVRIRPNDPNIEPFWEPLAPALAKGDD